MYTQYISCYLLLFGHYHLLSQSYKKTLCYYYNMNSTDILKEAGITSLNDIPVDVAKNILKKQTRKAKRILNVDMTTDKSKYILEYINTLLRNIGRPAITKFDEFKNIPRDELITPTNEQYAISCRESCKKLFGKISQSVFYHKTHKCRCIALLRWLLKQNNLVLSFTSVIKEIDHARKTIVYYECVRP